MENVVVRTYAFIRSPRTRGQAYGKSDTIRLLECKVCGRKFSERAHTALSGGRPRVRGEKIISILHHLSEGCGQRQICRLLGVSRDAVSRLTRIAGDHAKSLHDELVMGVQVKEAQADEKWSFVEKKKRKHARMKRKETMEISGIT